MTFPLVLTLVSLRYVYAHIGTEVRHNIAITIQPPREANSPRPAGTYAQHVDRKLYPDVIDRDQEIRHRCSALGISATVPLGNEQARPTSVLEV